MADERPQYYQNTLSPLVINADSLAETLEELRLAVRYGAEAIQANEGPLDKWPIGGMFKFMPGIALAFLRLDYQSSVLDDGDVKSLDYRQLALERIPSDFPDIPLLPSRLAPAGSLSPIPGVSLRVFSAVAKANWKNGSKPSLFQEDITCLYEAAQLALKNGPLVPHDGRNMGGDEMLYGRAGLLWVLLNIRAHQFDESTQKALEPVYEAIPKLVDVIVDSGRQGSKAFIEKNGAQEAHPLMYAWMEGHYCFGAVHGITGILSIILAAKSEELERHLPEIGETITALCKMSLASNGHLPMTLPPFSFGQTSELVQLCHGSPGILILLAEALKNKALTEAFWCPEWNQTIYEASQRIWEEGLLSKGGSLCHGITGNAWPWLLLHNAFEYHAEDLEAAKNSYLHRTQASLQSDDVSEKLTPDFFLSKALTFILHSRETRPYNSQECTTADKDYRMPDDPYSLSEGLAGNVCAWAEACAVIQARLRKMELSKTGFSLEEDLAFKQAICCELGFPFVGGNGATGLI
ncbi:hypothetical protein N7478_013179 [Penicillium angulare]|uniref:uncharacterized protein n=1 Tax=Penicillium angulare TaxID=116970 RepID=UPI002540B8CA|nr:uncharacterized protein N7478_013179 [Penicillium angulare]KAJ5257075.1 hypothetical protein N7478_013179 [Penicillium angulare]